MIRPATAALVTALPSAVAAVGWPEVAGAWAEPSALEGYTVGGLAAHLGLAIARGVEVLSNPEPEEPLAPLGAWFGANKVDPAVGVDGGWHRLLRDLADDRAAAGPAEVAAWVAEQAERLGSLAPTVPPARRVAVASMEGVSATAADYLASRLVEVVVHVDDLAASVGRDSPFRPDVVSACAHVLVDVACGQWPPLDVVRALVRAERADPDVIPVL